MSNKRIFYNIDSLNMYLMQYANQNLFENENQTKLFENVFEKISIFEFEFER
jgi:GTP1/Obg family GTP-binding protein